MPENDVADKLKDHDRRIYEMEKRMDMLAQKFDLTISNMHAAMEENKEAILLVKKATEESALQVKKATEENAKEVRKNTKYTVSLLIGLILSLLGVAIPIVIKILKTF